MHSAIRFMGVFAVCLLAPPAPAATTGGSFNVTANVGATCTVVTTGVAFGTYNPASSTPTNASGAVTVTCTSGTTYSIALNAGAHAGGASVFGNRRMLANVSDFLPYQLYLDSFGGTVWGDGTNSSSINPTAGTFTGTGVGLAHTVYGQIAAGNYVASGAYSDTINVTVTYN